MCIRDSCNQREIHLKPILIMGMSIDGIFSEVGELGRQQFKYITLINILHIYFPFYMLQYTFVARNVDFYCNLNNTQVLNGDPSTTLSTNDLGVLDKTRLLDGLETNIEDSSKFKYCPSSLEEKCSFIFMEQKSMWVSELLTATVNKKLSKASESSKTKLYEEQHNENKEVENVSSSPNQKKKARNFPDFKESHKHGQPSIVTEWELVCDKSWLRPATMSSFMAGVLLGSLVLGSLSDKIGRKPTIIFTLVCMIASNGIGSFVHR